jgi:hypothetical protein
VVFVTYIVRKYISRQSLSLREKDEESGGSSEKMAELPKENPLACSAFLFDIKGDKRTNPTGAKTVQTGMLIVHV